MAETIDRETLHAKLDNRHKPVLVEALPVTYYEQVHLPGAVNIPHDAVDALAAELLPDKNAEIVVYCASATCRNSDYAARRLTALGYRNVHTYVGGKADWIDAGLPIESGPRARRGA
jgi:rhodanese-related sulfurtransferase